MPTTNHIFPVHNQILNRSDKEKLLNQHAHVIWLTGLSGAGKTTLATQFELELNKRGYLTQILDGDNMRTGINSNLGFTSNDRFENIRRIAEVSKLFVNCGIICINSFISPTKEMRDMAKQIIGEKDFIEVYINASLEVCEKRDTKGLYKMAREGRIKNFTGIDAPFEPPENPDIEILTGSLSIIDSVQVGLDRILPLISYKNT
jgi:adenylylsulfate kinase